MSDYAINEIAAILLGSFGMIWITFSLVGVVRYSGRASKIYTCIRRASIGTCLVLTSVLLFTLDGSFGTKALCCAIMILLAVPFMMRSLSRVG